MTLELSGVLTGIGGFITAVFAVYRQRRISRSAITMERSSNYLEKAEAAVAATLSAFQTYRDRTEQEHGKLEAALSKERQLRADSQSEIVQLRVEIAGVQVEAAKLAREVALLQARHGVLVNSLTTGGSNPDLDAIMQNGGI